MNEQITDILNFSSTRYKVYDFQSKEWATASLFQNNPVHRVPAVVYREATLDDEECPGLQQLLKLLSGADVLSGSPSPSVLNKTPSTSSTNTPNATAGPSSAVIPASPAPQITNSQRLQIDRYLESSKVETTSTPRPVSIAHYLQSQLDAQRRASELLLEQLEALEPRLGPIFGPELTDKAKGKLRAHSFDAPAAKRRRFD